MIKPEMFLSFITYRFRQSKAVQNTAQSFPEAVLTSIYQAKKNGKR
jgi:hypothetical protein